MERSDNQQGMDAAPENPFVVRFAQFFENTQKKNIEKLVSKYPEKRSLEVDFKELEHFDFELADELLQNPDHVLEAAQLAIQSVDVPALNLDEFKPHVRIFNLPEEAAPVLRDIGSAQLSKLLAVEGTVVQITEVLPKLLRAVWECRRCGNTYTILQSSNNQQQPTICECRAHDFVLKSSTSTFVDFQKIRIQEPVEQLKGNQQPTNLDIYVIDDLVNRVTPGSRIKISGVLRLVPPKEKKLVYGRFLEAVHVEETEKDFDDLEITKEEEEEIKKLSKDRDIYEKLVKSIAPNIYGHEVVKESIAMQLFGGVKKVLPGQNKIRGNIHILLVGEPGMAKSALLQAVDHIAPKSVYTAGKTTSAAGLSATAVKDEFGEGGWTLKAGALVLASGGIALIDELDKMDAEDRSALHESMEQQSYHGDFEIDLIGEPKQKIGTFVENLLEENAHNVVKGNRTFFLDTKNKNVKILTTDFNRVYETKISQVSKHVADKDFFEIEFQNGRKIKVTENHPFFVLKEGTIQTFPASELKENDFIPAPSSNPFKGQEQKIQIPQDLQRKKLELPAHNSAEFFRFLGYHITDGGYELNRGAKNGINFSNKAKELLDDYVYLVKRLFNFEPYTYTGKTGVTSVRLISVPLLKYLENIDEKLISKSDTKRIPPQFMNARTVDLAELLRSLFDGDGGFYFSNKIPRLKFVTPNYELAMQVQDLLLRFGIISTIFLDKNYKKPFYRLDITGKENIEKYSKFIGFTSEKKAEKLQYFLSQNTKSRGFVIPLVSSKIMKLVQELKIKQNSFQKVNLLSKKGFSQKKLQIYIKKLYEKINELKNALTEIEKAKTLEEIITIKKRINISNQMIANELGVSSSLVQYYEARKMEKKYPQIRFGLIKAIERLLKKENETGELEKIVCGEHHWIKVKGVSKIPRKDEQWVYDIGIEPEHCFISNNLVLHNSISVAKAGMVTRFKTETSVLSAANPKYSRFDPYQNFMEQINLPASLVSRFDLFFMIRDVLDRKKDGEISAHILKTHQAGEMMLQQIQNKSTEKQKEVAEMEKLITPAINASMLKKYISYARQNIFPVLTSESIKNISDFYIDLRDQGRKQGTYAATHRQLEALVRLSEASARVRLSDVVEIEDTDRAIRLFKTALQELVVDQETGKIDFDIINVGRTQTELTNLKKILGIIKDKAREIDMVPMQDVIDEAKTQGLDEEKTKEIFSKLEKAGDIYRPKYGFVKPTQPK